MIYLFVYALGMIVAIGFIIGSAGEEKATPLQVILSVFLWPLILGIAFGMVCKSFKIKLR